MAESFTLPVVAYIESPYKEKFGIPRQPGLAPSVLGRVVLSGEYNQADCVAGLENCSHIWLQFIFHQSLQHRWRPKVRPPRLGGNASMGVFATRSPVRPSAIGLSVVKLEDIVLGDRVELIISGMDLLDQTPVLDIKPYLPYVDAVVEASNQFAEAAPVLHKVEFSTVSEQVCRHYQQQHSIDLRQILVEVLQQDPRPAYQQGQVSERIYGMNFLHFNVRWRYKSAADQSSLVEVVEIAEHA